jgi:hypothetical protein
MIVHWEFHTRKRPVPSSQWRDAWVGRAASEVAHSAGRPRTGGPLNAARGLDTPDGRTMTVHGYSPRRGRMGGARGPDQARHVASLAERSQSAPQAPAGCIGSIRRPWPRCGTSSTPFGVGLWPTTARSLNGQGRERDAGSGRGGGDGVCRVHGEVRRPPPRPPPSRSRSACPATRSTPSTSGPCERSDAVEPGQLVRVAHSVDAGDPAVLDGHADRRVELSADVDPAAR